LIISQTPLRVSFLGGGTDLPIYTDKYIGQVISTTIDKFVYALVTKRTDNLIYVGYTVQEVVHSIDKIQHDLVRECARICDMYNGFEVKTWADIPSSGSGLGSSSSVTVGLLNAFHAFKGEYASPKQLAEEACKVEIEILGNPIGRQDQYAAAFGGYNHIKFFPSGKVTVKKIGEIGLGKYTLIPTGISRSSSTVLKKQQSLYTGNEYAYQQLSKLVDEYFTSREFPNLILPSLVMKDWDIKKALVDYPLAVEILIDKVVDAGATSYKLLGAGGGGHILAYSEKPDDFHFQLICKGIEYLPFTFEPFGSKIIFNYRR